MTRVNINQLTIDKVKVKSKIISQLPSWLEMIERSFLSCDLKLHYQGLLNERCLRLGLI